MLNLRGEKIYLYQNPVSLHKRWTWVDPAKDAATNQIMVANGWKTNDQITADRGWRLF